MYYNYGDDNKANETRSNDEEMNNSAEDNTWRQWSPWGNSYSSEDKTENEETAPKSAETQIPSLYVPGSYNAVLEPVQPPKRKRGGALRAVCLMLACILLSGTAGYGGAWWYSQNDNQAAVTDSGGNSNNTISLGSQSPPNPAVTTTVSDGSGSVLTASQIYELGCTQVVGVTTEVTTANVFGQASTSTAVSGTGFIISEDGYIATNYHVVETAVLYNYSIYVTLYNGDSYAAEYIGGDEDNDVAVLKIEAMGLSAVTLGDSGNMTVGESVYTIGHPLGELTYTMTSGVVSALDREIATSSTAINMFQIDAAVNSGNSGGPVFNNKGEVIGIVTAKYSSSGVEGLGFAIPINDAVSLIEDIITNGYVTGKPYFGISVVTFSSSAAQYYNMAEGAMVTALDETSCAKEAGLEIGDIITNVDDYAITSSSDLVTAKNKYKAGDTVTLTVYRSGGYLELSLTFDEKAQTTSNAESSESTAPSQGGNPFGGSIG